MNLTRMVCFVGAGVATLTLSACSGGQHPSDAYPSSTVEPEKTVEYKEDIPPSSPAGGPLTSLNDPMKMQVLKGLNVDWLALPTGEDANRFDAIGGIGPCGIILTSVVPAFDDRFDIVMMVPGRNLGMLKQNTTVDGANTFIAENRSYCGN